MMELADMTGLKSVAQFRVCEFKSRCPYVCECGGIGRRARFRPECCKRRESSNLFVRLSKVYFFSLDSEKDKKSNALLHDLPDR